MVREIIQLVAVIAAAIASILGAWHAWHVSEKVETYHLQVNSRMGQFMELIEKSSFAAGQKDARAVDDAAHALVRADAAAKDKAKE